MVACRVFAGLGAFVSGQLSREGPGVPRPTDAASRPSRCSEGSRRGWLQREWSKGDLLANGHRSLEAPRGELSSLHSAGGVQVDEAHPCHALRHAHSRPTLFSARVTPHCAGLGSTQSSPHCDGAGSTPEWEGAVRFGVPRAGGALLAVLCGYLRSAAVASHVAVSTHVWRADGV